MSPADILLAESNVADIKDSRCVIQKAKRIRARADVLANSLCVQPMDNEDIVTWLRLFGAMFDELIDDADQLADDYQEKAELYDDNEDAIDNWKRVLDETEATDVDDVIRAFEKADKLDYFISELREFCDY